MADGMLDILRTRRSVRRFKPQPLPAQTVDLLKEAVLRSFSSRGINEWEFIFVDDKDLLAQLAKAKAHGSEFVKDAALAIVVAADPQRCDVWIEDAAIAAAIAHLTAHSLGLGSCWVQIRCRQTAAGQDSEQFVRQVLNLPRHVQVLAMVAVGIPDQKPKPIPYDQLPLQKIHHNRW